MINARTPVAQTAPSAAAGIAGCDPQNRDVSRDFASRGSFAALAARGKKATIAFFPGLLDSIRADSRVDGTTLYRGGASICNESPVAARPRRVVWLGIYLAVFGLLLAWRWEILAFPPYEDFLIGVFREAQFLEETNFDYHKLRLREPMADEGGAKGYVTSIVPPLIAIWMRYGPRQTSMMLVGMHLVYLALASLVLVMVAALAARRLGWWAALAAVAAVITTPLFSAQVDQLGLDMPMTACALVVAWLVLGERFIWAAVAGMLAFFMKATGAMLLVANIAYLMLIAGTRMLDEGRAVLPRYARGLIANVVALAVVMGIQSLADRPVRSIHGEMGIVGGYLSQCPDMLLLAGFCLVASLAIFAADWRNTRAADGGAQGMRRRVRRWISREPLLLFSCLVLVGTWLSIALYIRAYAPRYLTIFVPFLYLALAIALLRSGCRAGLAIFGLIIGFNLANSDGRFYRMLGQPETSARECGRMERSRGEYLADHRAKIEACRAIEDNCAQTPIVCARPMADYLQEPRFGYVKRPMSGYVINRFKWKEFAPPGNLLVDLPRELVFVSLDTTTQAYGAITLPRPEPGDEVIYTDGQRSPLLVFRRRLPESLRAPDAIEDWYLEELWIADAAEHAPAISVLDRARMLVKRGQKSAATRLLHLWLARQAEDVEARATLARWLADEHQLDEAAEQAREALRRNPGQWSCEVTLGIVDLDRGESDQAAAHLGKACRIAPEVFEARYYYALALVKSRKWPAALEQLNAAARLGPQAADVHNLLGFVYGQTGRLAEAADEFQRAIRLDPNLEAARQNLRRARELLDGAKPGSGAGEASSS